MSDKSIEDQYLEWRFARDYQTGQYLYDVDPKWKRECEMMLIKVEEQKLASARPAPVPNADDLALIQRAQAAVNPKTGRRFYDEPTTRDTVEQMRITVFNGGRISAEARAATEARLAELSQDNSNGK